MLESCRNAQERWGGVHLLIDRWLHERHALINAYDRLHIERDDARQAYKGSASIWSTTSRPAISKSTNNCSPRPRRSAMRAPSNWPSRSTRASRPSPRWR